MMKLYALVAKYFLVFIVIPVIPLPAVADNSEEIAVATMRRVEEAWKEAFESRKQFVSPCSEQTWSINRLVPGALVQMDIRRTDSIVTPLKGLIYIRGRIETNSNSPSANGFHNQYASPPRTICFSTLDEARKSTSDEDWSPSNELLAEHEFELIYEFEGQKTNLVSANKLFFNAMGDDLDLPENTNQWSAVLSQ